MRRDVEILRRQEEIFTPSTNIPSSVTLQLLSM